MNRWLTLLIAIGLPLAPLGTGVHGEAPPASAQSAPTPQEVRAWIRELSHNRFEAREAATKRLEGAGGIAVPLLSEAAQGENLEVTCRAIRALEGIANRGDQATFEASQNVLELLAASPNRSIARRADLALRGLGSARRRHAVARIIELGGIERVVKGRPSQTSVSEDPPPTQIILNRRWKGGDAGLAHLRRIDDLGAIYLAGTVSISPDALKELERDFPQKLQFRGEAMLGISGMDLGTECVIDKVEPGSAAARAGLESGDTIVKYDGEEIPMFKRLIEITNRHSAGDKIVIEIIRDGMPMTLEAVLTEWQ